MVFPSKVLVNIYPKKFSSVGFKVVWVPPAILYNNYTHKIPKLFAITTHL